MTAVLPDCPVCGGTGTSEPVFSGSTIGYVSIICKACDGTGKVTVAQMAAQLAAVRAALDHHDWTIDSAVACVSAVAKAVRP